MRTVSWLWTFSRHPRCIVYVVKLERSGIYNNLIPCSQIPPSTVLLCVLLFWLMDITRDTRLSQHVAGMQVNVNGPPGRLVGSIQWIRQLTSFHIYFLQYISAVFQKYYTRSQLHGHHNLSLKHTNQHNILLTSPRFQACILCARDHVRLYWGPILLPLLLLAAN